MRLLTMSVGRILSYLAKWHDSSLEAACEEGLFHDRILIHATLGMHVTYAAVQQGYPRAQVGAA